MPAPSVAWRRDHRAGPARRRFARRAADHSRQQRQHGVGDEVSRRRSIPAAPERTVARRVDA